MHVTAQYVTLLEPKIMYCFRSGLLGTCALAKQDFTTILTGLRMTPVLLYALYVMKFYCPILTKRPVER